MFTLFGKPYRSTKQTPPTKNQNMLLIESLYNAPAAGMNKLELHHQNFMGIAPKLKTLRDHGAIIVTRIATYVDSSGQTRPGMAHYTLCGFLDYPEYDNPYRQRYEELRGHKYTSSL